MKQPYHSMKMIALGGKGLYSKIQMMKEHYMLPTLSAIDCTLIGTCRLKISSRRLVGCSSLSKKPRN